MEFSDSAKEEVKLAANIVEVIGQFVQLKKAGQNYHGLCPFHSEKDPSFTVSPSKQMFHCFGCKKGGDVFAFWMDYHNVSFPQALRDLASRYQIPLPEPKRDPAEAKRLELRDILFKLNRLAADFYHQVLTDSKSGGPGRSYFGDRGIDEQTVSDFTLGFAPDRWDGLSRYLRNRNVDMEKAVGAGLVIRRKQGGWYDRFRGRVVFPIYTPTGRIAGFGARVLDDSLPKYLNTPETPVFRKGEILYGLHTAGPAIRRSRRAVVVGGYTDVLALHTQGFPQAVATLGTALTRDHIRRLKGYAEEVIVVFDSDEAGKTAALKSLPFFLAEGVTSRVLILPEGEDPDSFVRSRGLEQFTEALDGAAPMFDFFIDVSLESAGEGAEARVRALRDILRVLAGLGDRALSALYVRRLAERTAIPEATILYELKGASSKAGRASEKEREAPSRPGIDEVYLLHLLVHYPGSVGRILESGWEALITHEAARSVFSAAARLVSEEREIVPADIAEALDGDEAAGTLLSEIMVSAPIIPEDAVDQAVDDFLAKIRMKSEHAMSDAARQGDLERANKLLHRKWERLSRP
ncbi:MAG: DNA primase [Deltaproteobacteria bacterium]|nr:DNA primase [Deltaproteobacteria bacterium]